MTEIETLIAVVGAIAGTILGSAITHVFEQRGRAQQTRQDIAFKPSEDRYLALKTLYTSMDNCLYSLFGIVSNMPKSMQDYDDRVVKPVEDFGAVIRKNALWLQKVLPAIIPLYRAMAEAVVAIKLMMPPSLTGIDEQSRPAPGTAEFKFTKLNTLHPEAVRAIGEAMGIEPLERGLENIFRQLREKPIGG